MRVYFVVAVVVLLLLHNARLCTIAYNKTIDKIKTIKTNNNNFG